jgi:phosphoenolpyruvate carboxylase
MFVKKTPRILAWAECAAFDRYPLDTMNLLTAPVDLSSKDVPLRDDIRLLGRILGDTLREQEGNETFELVENVRRTSVRFRKSQDDRDRDQLEQVLDALTPAETLSVVRAFSYFSQLSNIAEDLHHNRRRRAHLKAGSPPQEGSLQLALDRIADKDLSAAALQAFFDKALISPVLTAHPTEVQRKSILDCHHRQAVGGSRQAGHDPRRNRRQRRSLAPLCADFVGHAHVAFFQNVGAGRN